jgi:hypothetical protein
MAEFHRLEAYGYDHKEGNFLNISFRTGYRGIWQCHVTESGIGEFTNEPSFQTLKSADRKDIKEISMVVFYLTHNEVPSL